MRCTKTSGYCLASGDRCALPLLNVVTRPCGCGDAGAGRAATELVAPSALDKRADAFAHIPTAAAAGRWLAPTDQSRIATLQTTATPARAVSGARGLGCGRRRTVSDWCEEPVHSRRRSRPAR